MDENGPPAPPQDEERLPDRLSLLQELYQRKHAEILLQFQQSQALAAQDYLQSLQLFSNLPGTQHPQLGALRQMSSEQSSEDVEMPPASSSAKEQSSSTAASIRNRRAFSGSGQTISQHTRDRLKTMIASKKQKQRLHSSGSSGSATNIAASSASNLTWMPPSAGCSETNLAHPNAQSSSASAGTANAHFEPYPLPSPTMHNPALMSEYQLRKVNSEPNLKMRIRARLLNKSPVVHMPSAAANPHPYSNNHRPLQRCDSDSVPMELFTKQAALSAVENPLHQAHSTSTLPFPSSLMIPSPSLPNLTNGVEHLQLDMANLMMQAQLANFLSMPSLLKNPLFPPTSILEQQPTEAAGTSSGSNRPTVKFDTRTLTAPLPIGGYPSLLKQQLRDLVLRRKSLVREEPEDETNMETFTQKMQTLSETQGAQLKSGLAYDPAMSKHQCLCAENQNHVEHGGRVHSIWARLQERGLVDMCERIPMRKASLDLLKLVHSPTYVTFFAVSPTACLKLDPSELPLKSFVQLPCGGIGVDSDTYFNDASTQLAIRVAVGSLVELASQVAEGKLRNGFACIRPPGHHAEREQAMGFCYFNNVSITARYLQQRYGSVCQRIAIIDWDVHHGNGTQLCFEADPSVLYISMHRHDNGNFFPGTVGTIMGDAEYLAAWRVLVLPLLEAFKTDFILVSSGFDAARGHPAALGGYEVSPQLFGYFTRTLMSYANGRVVLALEGGYDLPSICDSAEECVKALCSDGGDISRLSSEVLEKVPNMSAQETIQKVIAVHKKHWTLTGAQGINTSELHWQTISQRFSSLTVQS
ncbi:CRE-HDA-4 protein [Aphelenchoides avenae]|nr:CRE-HDA-4 protein [Aphelenchus avenae]